ncbi:NYN domain-containing protein [Salisaeta longa]|uniref:NYN domain-containing protein n=1 Tax=Salisaeta longa TaxID=503170 RepID=UPI0003B5B168|nr:NYN domain-containing protein [Salisaeta longa]
MTYVSSPSTQAAQHAGVFVDYENLLAVLQAQSPPDALPRVFAEHILREAQRYLADLDDVPTVMGRAYADFTAMEEANGPRIQRELHRMGIDPVVTLRDIQSNASEQQLCIDVTEVLHTRGDLQTILIVTGNRPFLPLVRTIRAAGRRVLVTALNPPEVYDTSFAEEDVYLDARNFLDEDTRNDLRAGAARSARSSSGASFAPPEHQAPIEDSILRRAVEVTEEFFGQYDEVYLTPLLRKLSEELGEEYDPKAIVSDLEAVGAAVLEKRDGYPYDYTVLIVNDQHPDVQEIHDAYYSRINQMSNGYYATRGGEASGATPAEETAADSPEGAPRTTETSERSQAAEGPDDAPDESPEETSSPRTSREPSWPSADVS